MNTIKDKYIESTCSKKVTEFPTDITFNDTKIIVSFAIDDNFDFRNFMHDKNKAFEMPFEDCNGNDTLIKADSVNDVSDKSSIFFISLD